MALISGFSSLGRCGIIECLTAKRRRVNSERTPRGL